MLLGSELRENWLPLLVFLICMNWLFKRSGITEKIILRYSTKNQDHLRIVVPTIATLTLPFLSAYLYQELSVFSQSDTPDVVKFSIPTVATLATFVWRQETENRKAASSREEKKDSAFYLMHSELVRNQKFLVRNCSELNRGTRVFEGYLISPHLDTYRIEDLEYALRNFPHTLNDIGMLVTVENIRMKADEANLAISKRDCFLEETKSTATLSKEAIDEQLKNFSLVIDKANECLREDFASLKKGIRHLVYKS